MDYGIEKERHEKDETWKNVDELVHGALSYFERLKGKERYKGAPEEREIECTNDIGDIVQ